MQIGTQVIDHLVMTMTKKELQQAGETVKQVHLQHCHFQKEYCQGPILSQVQVPRGNR